MANRELGAIFRGLRARLLILLLVIAVVAVFSVAFMAVISAQSTGRSAEILSSQALRTQAENSLMQLTQSGAKENNLTLEQITHDAQKIASYLANIYDDPSEYQNQNFWIAADHIHQGVEGQYSNGVEDISSVFLPNSGILDEKAIQDMELSAYLDLILPPVLESNPNVKAIYFGSARDVVRYYPNIDLGTVLPPDFRATQRVWYTSNTPLANPKGAPLWTPAYLDATGLGIVTTAAAPVYSRSGEFIGVVGFDVTLNDMKASVEATQFMEGGYSLMVDNKGRAIALPDQGYQDILGRPPKPDEFGTDLHKSSNQFAPILTSMLSGKSGFKQIDLNGRQLFVAYAPIQSAGWSIASVVPSEDVLQSVQLLQQNMESITRSLVLIRVLPISAAIFLLVIVLGLILTGRIVGPVQKLAAAAQKIGAGQWDAELPTTGSDEIGLLANAFRRMIAQLHDLVTQLENRVAERTHDLERRAIQLQTAGEVASEITAVQNLDDLLNHTVNLVRERFGFYHAGIFLVDDHREYAILKSATGEAGQKMLERRHKLKVGEQGIVGYVTDQGEPRIALDVGADAVHFRNPLLPSTRSEMALPLKVGDRVIGALDVQSERGAAFDQEDVAVLQTLADQLAVAIENARLVERLEKALDETSTLVQQQVQEAWSLTPKNRRMAYEYDRLEVTPYHPSLPKHMLEKLQEGHAVILEPEEAEWEDSPARLIVPLMVRDQLIGVIGLEDDNPDRKWTPDEIAIVESTANQAALTLENARLLEDVRQRAQHEQLVSQISAKAQTSLNLETILRSTVADIGKALDATRVQIRLANDGPSNDEAGNGHHKQG